MNKKILILFALLIFTTNAFALGDSDIKSWWKFDTNTASITPDYKSFNDANTSTALRLAGGLFGTDYNFKTTTDYVQADTFKFRPDKNFSINLWVKTNMEAQCSSGGRIFSNFQSGVYGWIIDCGGSDYAPRFGIGNGSSFVFATASGVPNKIPTGNWRMITGTYDGNSIKLYLDGTFIKDATGTTKVQYYGEEVLRVGAFTYPGSQGFLGQIDEVSVYENKILSPSEITFLWNGGTGIQPPFTSTQANFTYSIDKTIQSAILKDASIVLGGSITAWTWKLGDTNIAYTQDYNYPTTALQDLNICLRIDSNIGTNSTKCSMVYTGDWNAPTTTATATQYPVVTPTTKISFTCTDNNSGCKYTTFKFNSGDWNTQTNTGTLDINTGLTGTNTVYYYSTDNSDNNETQKSLSFTTYGFGHFQFYDENTGLSLSGVTVDWNGTPHTTSGSTVDINFQGITTNTYTFTFSKTGYSTRYYQIDLNQYSDFNYKILLLPTNKSYSTTFQFFNPTATTTLANSYVLVTNFFRNGYTERIKTDSTGFATFQLNTEDGNYGFHIDYGGTIYDYNSISLTINRPKDEVTLADINANWSSQVTGVAVFTDTNLSASTKALLVYSNTESPYFIRIGSLYNVGGVTYFSRGYNIQIQGYPGSQTITPYLLSNANGLSQLIKTQNSQTFVSVPGIDVKIYRLLQGTGRTLVEEEYTSSTGDATWSAISGQTYFFDVYQNGVLNQQLTITGLPTSGNTYYIYFNDTSVAKPDLNKYSFTVSFIPGASLLQSFIHDLNQVITVNNFSSTILVSKIDINVVNTNVGGVSDANQIVYNAHYTNPTIPFTNQIPINLTAKTINGVPYDTNGYLVVNVKITSNNGIFNASYTYTPYTSFNIVNNLGFNLRPLFGCSATNNPMIPCGSLLLFALFISIVVSVAVGIATGNMNFGTIGFLFLFLTGIFTYITWIPYILYAIMLAGVFGLIIAEGGRRV